MAAFILLFFSCHNRSDSGAVVFACFRKLKVVRKTPRCDSPVSHEHVKGFLKFLELPNCKRVVLSFLLSTTIEPHMPRRYICAQMLRAGLEEPFPQTSLNVHIISLRSEISVPGCQWLTLQSPPSQEASTKDRRRNNMVKRDRESEKKRRDCPEKRHS